MKRALLVTALFMSSTCASFAQKATKVTLTFATTADDKDWNSEMRSRIVCNGLVVAQLNCCNQNRQVDHWANNTTTSRDILNPQPFTKASLSGCTLILGLVAVGNDTWVMIPTIDVFYDDGSHVTQAFDQTVLTSSGGNVNEHSYALK